jgi:hypothetical protein
MERTVETPNIRFILAGNPELHKIYALSIILSFDAERQSAQLLIN